MFRYDFEDDVQNPQSGLLQAFGKATVLDPRFKHEYLSEQLYEVVKTQLAVEGKDMYAECTPALPEASAASVSNPGLFHNLNILA